MPALFRFVFIVLLSTAQLLTLTACANDDIVFVPPADRPLKNSDKDWPVNHVLALAYHDIEDSHPDQAYVSVRTDHLIDQLAWLRENDYQPVSIDQILDASNGNSILPEKAVLLTFDDGYSSFYTRVFPILQAYQWPAVLAPVGKWLDTPEDQDVEYGGQPADRSSFLTWQQVKEVSDSGLVEIASHTYDLHKGILANPQGNELPAAAARIYDPVTKTYEDDDAFHKRLERDVYTITARLREVTGKQPRVWVWPYGRVDGTALQIALDTGYSAVMKLENGLIHTSELINAPRVLVSGDPPLDSFARSAVGMEDALSLRVMHVDLDYVYDDDAEQMERNLGQLVQRVADMQVNAVFLQAFADPEGDGLVKSLYFPNRHLPMRADLFNRAAWQLRTRAFVQIFAWMPVLAFDLPDTLPRVQRWYPDDNSIAPDPDQYARLSPFDNDVRTAITEIYEDLAKHALMDGVLFHDDAMLTDFEDAGPTAMVAYEAAGLPSDMTALRGDSDTLQRWTRFKSRALIDFTDELAKQVREIQGAAIKTARNMYAMPILEPHSETWFAQNLDDFLGAYDWTAPMAMPLMEGVSLEDSNAWLGELVEIVRQRPGALDKTVFEIQARDWTQTEFNDQGHIPAEVLAEWIRQLQMHGARSLGYYPDDFVTNEPRIEVIRPAISNAWYPHQ